MSSILRCGRTRLHSGTHRQGSIVQYRSIKSLQAAFRDPSSPFHLPPGTQGPAHEEDHGLNGFEDEYTSASLVKEQEARREAREALLKLGYDPTSFWEQPVVWGDHDSFQHVNNVRYVRYFESGRIKWMTSLGREIGGPERADAMVKGKGVSLILKSINIDYKRPVTFPDTLLIAHKPHAGSARRADHTETGTSNASQKLAKTHFHVLAVAWSFAQRRIVTESDSVLVWYDYDKLAKCDPGEQVRSVLERRMSLGREHSRHG